MWRELHPNVRVRIVNSFLTRMVGGAVFPFMAIYFTRHLGPGLAGALLAALVGVQFVAGLYGGGLADVWGRRRTLLAGEWLKLAAFLVLLAANLHTPLPWVTFAALTVINVSSGLINPAAEAMLVDVSTPETRTFMYAVNYWAINASLLIGTLLGGWLYQDHFGGLLAGLCAMSGLTLFLAWSRMTETLGGARPSRAEVREQMGLGPLARNYAQVMGDRAFRLFLLGFLLLMTIEFGRSNFIPVHLAASFPEQAVLGLTLDGVKAMSVLTAVNTVMIVALTVPVTGWVKGRDRTRLMTVGFGLFALGFAVLNVSLSLPVLIAASVLLSLGELLYVPTRQALLADMVPGERRGAYLAVNGQTFTVGKWLAALGLPLGAGIGGAGMALVTLLLGLLAIWLSLAGVRGRQRAQSPTVTPALGD
ncbi:DHA1 family multidrug resistance protein B-like MFS transporter [Deinococcus budaensis]|uniref:DHA1 family multidrug resistance protein B-like MFS transporter n=1 Tax=Deinococcus budaensis TaxID=1665626 RepID=A0A7W8LQI1_9DEIO|nr:MFS transporter [Deinococcus budaensis]MBB5234769.1 DHA1 family multidrug resistance protein B-like MFS transporter [Deinococcus budaensis]